MGAATRLAAVLETVVRARPRTVQQINLYSSRAMCPAMMVYLTKLRNRRNNGAAFLETNVDSRCGFIWHSGYHTGCH